MANKTTNQLTEDTSPTSDDFLLMWDNATGTTKKVTIQNALLLLLSASTSFSWTSYTPTMTNVTLGNGTLAGRYRQIGKQVHFSIKLNFGTTTVVTGAPQFLLPVQASSFYAYDHVLGMGDALDLSAAVYYLVFATWVSPTKVALREIIASGTYATHDNPSSGAPFTWANGDIVSIDGVYEAA